MAKTSPTDDTPPTQLFSKVSKLKGIRAPQTGMPSEKVAEIADKAGFPDRPVVYGGGGEAAAEPAPRRPRRASVQRNIQRNLRMTQEVSDLIDAIAETEGCMYSVALERAIVAYAKAKGISA